MGAQARGDCVCARDYKSHSANGISVLLTASFYAWQMTMLSAHTIFLLPGLRHIVLIRKQTFQPILSVTVHGSGRPLARLSKHTRHTQGHGAEARELIRDPDIPKGGASGRAVSFTLLGYLCSPQCRACSLTAPELLRMFAKLRGSLGPIPH